MTRPGVAVVLAFALLVPAVARAETVPGSQQASDSLLAVAPDGSPRVGFVADGAVELATRAADGTWSEQPLGGFPGTSVLVVGLAVAPNGSAVVLAEDSGARWLALAEQQAGSWRVRVLATAPADGLLGFGGLALDHSGRPLVAYVSERASHKTSLRLVHEDSSGRLIGERVTRGGFPPSNVLPAAAPVVLPNGSVRVVEAYDLATIEWTRTKSGKDWIGQYLYGTALGEPAGVIQAAADGGAVWSAWTELFPAYDESELLLALHRNGEHTTVLHRHAYLVSLALPPSGPEVAADDYLDLLGARTVFAGIVVDAAGATVELGGNLEGYAIDAAGGRHYLLAGPEGLDWYRSPTPPAASVALTASVDGASFALSGRVADVSGGSVELWRETESGSELAATLPLEADGTFSTTDTPPVRPLTYRAIYRDPASGLPLASLVRSVLGA